MQEPIPSSPSLTWLLLRKLCSPSVLVMVGILLYSILGYSRWVNWSPDKPYPFHNDVDQYYSYLPARFLHYDLDFNFDNEYWLITAPNGHRVPKVTMGMAFMYYPFFVMGDAIASDHGYPQDGYSPPYAWSIHFGSIFYVLLGLWFTRKTLLLFFNEWITALALALLLFGTNLFYYTYVESEMAHGYLFCLFSLFLYYVLRWHQTYKTRYLLLFSFLAGLATLIRPTEVLILLFPLLWKVTSLQGLKERFRLIVRLRWVLILVVFCFLLPILPQLWFWKKHAGQFLFFSYGSEEGFFFGDPKFFKVLFSYRKGWLMYTPLMVFSLSGLIWSYFKWRDLFVPLCCYFLINLYLIASWWDWGFGGGLGMRALVHSYAFLVLALAFMIQQVFALKFKPWLKGLMVTVFLATCLYFSSISLLFCFLRKCSVIHWDGMSKKAYCYTFLKLKYDTEDRLYLDGVFESPDYDAMRKGKRDD